MAEQEGILVRALSGFYYVSLGDEIFECKARGAFRNRRITPLVGDTVYFETLGDQKGVLNDIAERKNSVIRPPLANIDRMFIVSSLSLPAPNTLLIDRQISICEKKGIEPIIVFNKTDEGDALPFAGIYKKAGFSTVTTSCETGEGIDELRGLIGDGINVFTGNSGVGKSSILNHLLDGAELATADISVKLGRGRHTTRTTELFRLGSGYVADTAGFSSFDIESCETVMKDELADTFREFRDHLGSCRFSTCSHTCEKGCAVIEAVKNGEIPGERHKNYCTIYSEIKDVRDWNKKGK